MKKKEGEKEIRKQKERKQARNQKHKWIEKWRWSEHEAIVFLMTFQPLIDHYFLARLSHLENIDRGQKSNCVYNNLSISTPDLPPFTISETTPLQPHEDTYVAPRQSSTPRIRSLLRIRYLLPFILFTLALSVWRFTSSAKMPISPLITSSLPSLTPGPHKQIGYAYLRTLPYHSYTRPAPQYEGKPVFNLADVSYAVYYPCKAPRVGWFSGEGRVGWMPDPVGEMTKGYERFLGQRGLSVICAYLYHLPKNSKSDYSSSNLTPGGRTDKGPLVHNSSSRF